VELVTIVQIAFAAAAAVAALTLLAVAFDRSRRRVLLALAVLAYQTFAAMVFVGATRYRVATDFLLALLAAGAIDWVLRRRQRRLQ
jgi:hypothetical protein